MISFVLYNLFFHQSYLSNRFNIKYWVLRIKELHGVAPGKTSFNIEHSLNRIVKLRSNVALNSPKVNVFYCTILNMKSLASASTQKVYFLSEWKSNAVVNWVLLLFCDTEATQHNIIQKQKAYIKHKKSCYPCNESIEMLHYCTHRS